tara:strand:- start:611 stop:1162 length:552 start_codon:yes stop_codon:yes gene_type:complete
LKYLFDLKDRKVTFSPQALMIPELKTIWDADKTKEKVEAVKKLSYIYFLCDYKSPYVLSVPPELVGATVARDFLKDEEYLPCPMVSAAIDKYRELQQTPSMGLLEAATITIHKLSSYLRSVDLSERDKAGKPVYKPSDVTNSLKSIGGIVESMAKVKDQIEKETVAQGKLRGQRKKGNREDPR